MDRRELNRILTDFAARVGRDYQIVRGLVVDVESIPGPPGEQGIKGDTGQQGNTGPQGIQGVQGSVGPVGASGLIWRGTWNSSTDYSPNDAVYYGGSSYFASGNPVPGDDPETDPDWNPLSLRGLQGVQGVQGIQGVKGDTGNTGAQGIQGVKGDAGTNGTNGAQGIQGVKGDTGLTGPQGPSGSAAGKAVRYTTGSQIIAFSGASTVVPLDTLGFNDDTNYYTFAANKITVKVSGLYLVAYSGNVSCSSTYSLFVQRNTTTIQEGAGVSGQTFSASSIVRLTAGDVLTLRVYGNAQATVSPGAVLSAVYLEGVKGDTGATGPALSATAGTGTVAGTCTATSFSCSRISNHVILHGYINLGANGAPANSLVLTMATGFRPLTNVGMRCPIYAAGGGFLGDWADIEFGTDGTVYIRTTNRAIPSGSILLLALSFVGA